MNNVWILIDDLSGSAYAFSTREKAEAAMMDMIEYIRAEECFFLPTRNDVRTYCEKSLWDCYDMYIIKAEWQG